MSNLTNKANQIIELHTLMNSSPMTTKLSLVCAALYISAKGTKHFYETLEFLSEVAPKEFLKEFNELKEKAHKIPSENKKRFKDTQKANFGWNKGISDIFNS